MATVGAKGLNRGNDIIDDFDESVYCV